MTIYCFTCAARSYWCIVFYTYFMLSWQPLLLERNSNAIRLPMQIYKIVKCKIFLISNVLHCLLAMNLFLHTVAIRHRLSLFGKLLEMVQLYKDDAFSSSFFVFVLKSFFECYWYQKWLYYWYFKRIYVFCNKNQFALKIAIFVLFYLLFIYF